MRRNMFITGASGMLGSNLAWFFRKQYALTGAFNTCPVTLPGVDMVQVDLTDFSVVQSRIRAARPEVVVHCAGRVDMDRMETDREGARKANVLATRHVAEACADAGAKLVYISTDAVYSGGPGPHGEGEPPAPVNVYGRTKLEGELEALQCSDALVLRTNIFGLNIRDRRSLGEWFLEALSSGGSCTGFTDAICSTMYTFLFADVLASCLEQDLSGVYNSASCDHCSKYEFGRRLAEAAGYDPEQVRPGSLADADFVATRGRDLSLDVSKLEKALEKPLPTITESIACFLSDVSGESGKGFLYAGSEVK